MLRPLSRIEVSERMTSEEFLKYAPDDQKAELIGGVMIVPPPPLDVHERLLGFLFTLLRMYVETLDLGQVRGSRTAVILTDEQTYEPDILFVSQERVGIIQERGIVEAPDLVIEILSASTAAYDRGPKFRAYEQSGVRELWLLDPYGPAGTEFYQREGNRLKPVMPDGAGFIHSTTLPGFKLDTNWLWPADKFITIREALKIIDAD